MSDSAHKDMCIHNMICDNEGEQAVLKMPEILENVFKFCSYSDLKCCRLVCKSWRNAATSLWLTWAHVTIQEIGTKTDRQMSEYLQFAIENDTHVRVNFSITLYSTVYDFTTFIPFWELYGPQINNLKLDVNMFPKADTVRDILFRYCPNMTSLSFTACYVGKTLLHAIENPQGFMGRFNIQENKNVKLISISPESIICANISWTEIFSNYPNLEGLQLEKTLTQEHVKEVFNIVNTIRKYDSKKLKLKNVHALVSYNRGEEHDGIPPSLLEFLLSPSVKMTNLSLTLNTTEDISRLFNVLSTHAPTLSTLVLDTTKGDFSMKNDDFLSHTNFKMQPILPRLCELTLPHSVLKLLKFLTCTPNLKKLVIIKGFRIRHLEYYKISQITLGTGTEDFSICSLTELELDHYETVDGIWKLVRWFPNVKRLKIPLSNETFELVCQGWPNLISLNINKSTVDECGITGLDGCHVVRINIAKGNFCKRPATVPRANITALKQLKSFHMTMNGQWNSPYSLLNFCSVVHGFKKAACPETIFIKGYQVNAELLKLDNKIFTGYYKLF